MCTIMISNIECTLSDLNLKKQVNKENFTDKEENEWDSKTISLAGYTSAGKTTLFNKTTGETKIQSKELFTTLSTTTRRVIVNQKPFLIADTVGFISKLPAYMIEAFKSTLEELRYTDIIILVIDISDSIFELKKKFASCMRTLNELDVENNRIIYALNKIDLIEDKNIEQKIEILNLQENKKTILISSKTGKNIDQLKELIKNVIDDKN